MEAQVNGLEQVCISCVKLEQTVG